MPPTECFTCLNTFIGYGNPATPVWFVGLEDGIRTDGWAADAGPEIVKAYSPTNNPMRFYPVTSHQITEESRTTHIYNYMADILRRLRIGTTELLDRSVYRDTVLAQNYFQMNVRSLALHRNTDWPAHYPALFGITVGEYDNLLVNERYPRLRAFHAEHKPQFTVCFGTGKNMKHWQRFEQMLGLSSTQRRVLSPHVSYHQQERVFLTPFFGQCGRPLGCLSYEILDCVVETIRSNKTLRQTM